MNASRPQARAFGIGLWLVAACGAGDPNRIEVQVFAASSLTDAFTDLEAEYERLHPSVDLRIAYAGSQSLRLQIEHGATADVFASANDAHLDALEHTGQLGARRAFARNELVLIVPADNPAAIETFTDLSRARRIVLGMPGVPIGGYTQTLLERAGSTLGDGFAPTIDANVVSREANVRLVRAKVELGEADAAIVYRTDAQASTRVRAVDVPEAFAVRARYSIAPMRDSRSASDAAGFIEFVVSPEGQALLSRRGFEPVEGAPR